MATTTPLSSSSRVNSSPNLDQSQCSTISNTTAGRGTTKLAELPVSPDIALLKRREIDLGEVLGRGRYSEVNAIELVDGAGGLPSNGRYVMKHIQNKLFSNRGHRRAARDLANAIADLVTEAMYLAKLRHPHIVQLRGLTKGGTSLLKRSKATGEDYFLILDRMEETLDQRIDLHWRRQTPTRSLLLKKTRYAWQMASVLNYLHNHQILYRDFKPENIGFVLQDATLPLDDFDRDRLQLFDFGLARELDEPPPPPQQEQPEKLYTLSASGTRRYMAPEIFNGRGKYNYKADVYSWAIVLYECLAHVKPFADFTTQSHEELVCRLGGRPKLTVISWPSEECDWIPQLEALMTDAWHQTLSERPTMHQVMQRLQDILEQQGVLISEETSDGASSILNDTTSSDASWARQVQQQQHFFANDPQAVIFLQKKTSTSELTVATDPTASDSEVDDDPRARWSHSSNASAGLRSSVSSLGSMPRQS